MTPAAAAPHARLPTAIWTLGFVSLLMDISSEMIHSLLPVFLVSVLAASAFTVGLIEGVAEASALAVKLFSGIWSDRLGKRKPLALLGYGLGALSKPLFALAPGVGFVLGARLIDRVGKGLRGAPRDALVAEIAPAGRRGAAFGLRQALDTVGALLGPLLAFGLMVMWAGDVRAVFWVAVIPGALAVALLAFGVHEPERAAPPLTTGRTVWTGLVRLPAGCWQVVAIGGLFTLARFSEAFLVLRAQQGGLALTAVPLVMVVMNAVYSASAYPFGRLADRFDHRRLLVCGLLVLVAADGVLAASERMGTPWAWTGVGVALWGLHMGMTQGLLAAMVADSAPPNQLGTAYGVFNLASGVALLLASASAGWLWDRFGAATTFLAGGTWATLACLALWWFGPARRSTQ